MDEIFMECGECSGTGKVKGYCEFCHAGINHNKEVCLECDGYGFVDKDCDDCLGKGGWTEEEYDQLRIQRKIAYGGTISDAWIEANWEKIKQELPRQAFVSYREYLLTRGVI